jgi:hypothetical protein
MCKVKFEWHLFHQQSFDQIKKVIETEIQVILCYPDFNKSDSFHIYTDASDHQLGADIMQNKKPIAFFPRKLNTARKWDTTTERE